MLRGLSKFEWCQSFCKVEGVIWQKFAACMLSFRSSRIYRRQRKVVVLFNLTAVLALGLLFWLAKILYLNWFLFSPNRLEMKCRCLSQIQRASRCIIFCPSKRLFCSSDFYVDGNPGFTYFGILNN